MNYEDAIANTNITLSYTKYTITYIIAYTISKHKIKYSIITKIISAAKNTHITHGTYNNSVELCNPQ